MITNSDLDLISISPDALEALAVTEAAAPAAPSPDDDGHDEASRDAL